MLSDYMVEALSNLSRADKLRAMQLLVEQLSQEETLLTASVYEIFTPYNNEAAANVLEAFLKRSE
jgi:hypothetical protein